MFGNIPRGVYIIRWKWQENIKGYKKEERIPSKECIGQIDLLPIHNKV
jgi:hypothetical protein